MRTPFHQSRRHFLTLAGTAVAAAQLGFSAVAAERVKNAPSLPAIRLGAAATLGPIKQVTAAGISIGYAEAGPSDGPVVILLHGWPYDIHSFADVAPALAAAGQRVIIPYLRGYGSTRLLGAAALRSGQPVAGAPHQIAFFF